MSEHIVGDDGFTLANVPHYRGCPKPGWTHTAHIEDQTRTATDFYRCLDCAVWVRVEIGLPHVR